MEVSGSLHALAALFPVNTLVSIEMGGGDAEWVPESVWTLRGWEKSFAHIGIRTPDCPTHGGRCTEYATPASLNLQ